MKARLVGASEAKMRKSQPLNRVDKGKITKQEKPKAEVHPAKPRGRLTLGRDAGRIVIGDDFDAPLPEFEEYMYGRNR
jgi:antitoxin (DNA-binding transcriptional repressor) of toxin-antitoxin stability system